MKVYVTFYWDCSGPSEVFDNEKAAKDWVESCRDTLYEDVADYEVREIQSEFKEN